VPHVRQYSYIRNGKRVNVRAHERRNRGRKNANSTMSSSFPKAVGGSKSKRVLAVTAVLGAGSLAVTLTVSGSPGAGANPSDQKPQSVQVSLTDIRQTEAVLLASGYKSTSFAVESDSNCAAHSYGMVNSFFKAHPCKWLARGYLAVHQENIGVVLVAVSWVGMPSAILAEKYKRLVDKGGTGNITELSRNTGPYRAIRFNGKFYTSGIDGSAVWNVQVQPESSVPSTVLERILNSSRQ